MESFLEHELKLDPPDDFVLPALDGEPLETRVFTSTYHDTPSRSLARGRDHAPPQGRERPLHVAAEAAARRRPGGGRRWRRAYPEALEAVLRSGKKADLI